MSRSVSVCLSLSLSPCDVVCVGVCGSGRGVCVCGVKNSVCRFKTPPCVHSKSLRVYPHHAHVLFSTCACCRYTRGRFERTHGDVLNLHTEGAGAEVIVSSAYQEKPTYGYRSSEVHHRNPWTIHVFSLRIDREQHVPDSSDHSLYLTKLLSSGYGSICRSLP